MLVSQQSARCGASPTGYRSRITLPVMVASLVYVAYKCGGEVPILRCRCMFLYGVEAREKWNDGGRPTAPWRLEQPIPLNINLFYSIGYDHLPHYCIVEVRRFPYARTNNLELESTN